MKFLPLLFILFVLGPAAWAQSLGSAQMTGNLRQDWNYFSKTIPAADDKIQTPDFTQKRSPVLSGLLSAILPGAGQVYNEEYWKAGLFLAAEAAMITFAVVNDKKGDDQTDKFQKFADEHWSAKRYAEWTMNHAKEISNNQEFDVSKYQVIGPDGSVSWSELNRLERDLGHWYSHSLPAYGEQQYYELIGKYNQYNMGWDDAGDANTPFKYGDPLTPRFEYYSGERGKANDFYSKSSTFVKFVILNHMLSSLEAILSTNRLNKHLNMNLSLKGIEMTDRLEYYPQLNLKYSF